MKNRIGFFALIAAAALLATWLYLKPTAPHPVAPAPSTPSAITTSSPTQGFEPAGSPSPSSRNPSSAISASVREEAAPTKNPEDSTNTPVSVDNQATLLAAIDAKADADTPESLKALVAYATDENKDIRSAALNGLIRRADTSAIPLLRAAAKASDSSQVIIELLQTADFLALPSVKMSDFPAGKKPARQQAPK